MEKVDVWFEWERFALDVKWVSARAVGDDWSIGDVVHDVLVHDGQPLDQPIKGLKRRTFKPYDESSGLFRDVAVMEPSREAIRAFVLKHGPLTYGGLFVPVDLKRRLPRPRKGVSLSLLSSAQDHPRWFDAVMLRHEWRQSGAVQGDSLSDWKTLIREMKTFVMVWDAIRQRRSKVLERQVHLSTQKGAESVTILDEAGIAVDGPRRFTDDDLSGLTLVQAAESCLTSVLAQRVSVGNSLTMYPPESRQRGRLAIVPRTLYDAIWLQFVLAFSGSKKYRACEVCGRNFEITPSIARKNRLLCGDACKTRAHRQRQQQAIALAQQGRTPSQIAEQVGSKIETVEGWIKQSQMGK